MTEYVRHVYTGRIYQIMRDHGPDNPYYWSPWEYAIRPRSPKREQFLRPCEPPGHMPTGYDISILDEIAWEDRKLRGSQPIVVHAPQRAEGSLRDKAKSTPQVTTVQPSGDYTIQDLAMELGCSPGQARKVLRSSKLGKPQGGWKWSSSEEAEPYRKFLKKSLK